MAAVARKVWLGLLSLSLTIALSACGSRPGSEVLKPQALTAPGAKVVTVYVATTRAEAGTPELSYSNDPANAINYASFDISIPPAHKAGAIEWPKAVPVAATDFVTVAAHRLDKTSFDRAVSADLSRARLTGPGVYVHGFNNNFQEALFRLAQMKVDAGVDGPAVLFAWPSAAEVTDYVADKDAATYSRDQLVELLTSLARLRAPKLPDDHILLLGHSMGGWLTMEAVRQLRLTGKDDVIKRLNVVLAAPDVDVDVFRSQLEVIGPMDPPMTVLVSPDDKALAVSQFIAGERQRVGAVDVTDPEVQAAATKAHLQIVDISKVEASDSLGHDRFANIAAFYPKLIKPGAAVGLRQAGGFVFDAIGATLSSPFTLVGHVLSGR
ncbi:alpha/beta hydrolase [Oryzibacter oryziterrae]|uniref:alpha/beta hydrolase n=1 Tax=Oryzibacter oryziterrae TaxID=2766474 RepID=UPI001F28521E|nr:alpha/beta fold hydrolase [Oryzibacter oryziterrae]